MAASVCEELPGIKIQAGSTEKEARRKLAFAIGKGMVLPQQNHPVCSLDRGKTRLGFGSKAHRLRVGSFLCSQGTNSILSSLPWV